MEPAMREPDSVSRRVSKFTRHPASSRREREMRLNGCSGRWRTFVSSSSKSTPLSVVMRMRTVPEP